MKKNFSFLFLILLHSYLFAQKTKVVAKANGNCREMNWQLKFEDNFDGEQLDLTTWRNRAYAQGTLDNEAAEVYYTLNNIKIENGICKLTPKKETITKKAVDWQPDSLVLDDGKINTRIYHYTSSWIETKREFQYGKYEIRCKIPKGKGLSSAFWMYGKKDGVNNEIDVFEFWNPKNVFGKFKPEKLSMIHLMTVHYNNKMSAQNYTGVDFSKEFHTYTVIWDSTKIEWLVDGISKRVVTKYLTRTRKNVSCQNVKAEHVYFLNPIFPKDPMAIIVSLAIQSGKNSPDQNTFNSVFEIDYIRFYEAE